MLLEIFVKLDLSIIVKVTFWTKCSFLFEFKSTGCLLHQYKPLKFTSIEKGFSASTGPH